jgi:folate-binding protein YgfZ
MSDMNDGYRTIREGAGAVWLHRDFIRVSGPDAIEFLQGQCSQDIAALEVGRSGWSWVLQPQGKVTALVRVTRVEADAALLDTDGGWGEPLLERLNRFKLRIKADLEPLAWRCLAIRGPGAAEMSGLPGVLAVDASWPGLPGVDLLGETIDPPSGVSIVDRGAYEATRIEAGVPVMGAELTDRTIPAETGINDRTVSFTKGCYTGQELVARIESRGGHVPRHLQGVRLAAPAPAGAILQVGGKKVGSLTSTADEPAVALAYVSRDVDSLPCDAAVEWEGGETSGRIDALPLVTSK